jgi:hypothetical protein
MNLLSRLVLYAMLGSFMLFEKIHEAKVYRGKLFKDTGRNLLREYLLPNNL